MFGSPPARIHGPSPCNRAVRRLIGGIGTDRGVGDRFEEFDDRRHVLVAVPEGLRPAHRLPSGGGLRKIGPLLLRRLRNQVEVLQ